MLVRINLHTSDNGKSFGGGLESTIVFSPMEYCTCATPCGGSGTSNKKLLIILSIGTFDGVIEIRYNSVKKVLND
jgi:hypothetical protein